MEKLKYLFLSFILLLVSNNQTFTQAKGSATAKSVPSDSNAAVGKEIHVNILIDLSNVQPPDNLLGNFDGLLSWDPSILQYVSHLGPLAGFTGQHNATKIDSGQFIFNGANPSGVGKSVIVYTITFSVLREDFNYATLKLEFSAMAAANTFIDLLPILTIDNGIVLDVNEILTGNQIPERFDLSNYPNPFNPETIINYQVPEKSQVSVKIYNLLGYEVQSLVEENKEPGYYSVKFDGKNLAAGVYLYILTAGNFTQAKKMLLLK